MNLKLLAGFAVVAVLMGIGSQSFIHAAFADSYANQERAQSKALAEAAGQEQAKILKEMQEKANPSPIDPPGG